MRAVAFELARGTSFLVAGAFALAALAWLGFALVIAILMGWIYGVFPAIHSGAFIALPALLPAGLAVFYFDRARTATPCE